MEKHHINHTYWCLNPNSGDTGGLLSHDFLTWDAPRYKILKSTLWQTDSGKFIGLDHQTALGKNGISLSEFYASGAKSNLDTGAPGHSVTPTTDIPKTTTSTTTTTTTAKPTTTTTTTTVVFLDTVTTTSTTVTQPVVTTTDSGSGKEIITWGDTNCDGTVELADAILIMQTLANPNKYAVTELGRLNGDVDKSTVGLTSNDAMFIQEFLLNKRMTLNPEGR